MSASLWTFLPQDRRAALAAAVELPTRTEGTALFADLTGFTPLGEALARELGPRRGSEELTARLETLYEVMIGQVELYGGSVIGFNGDAILCWFDAAPGAAATRAAACALALHTAIAPLAMATTGSGGAYPIALSVGLATGSARRVLVGDPLIQRLDVLAGRVVGRLLRAESLAAPGEVVADGGTITTLGAAAVLGAALGSAATGDQFAVLSGLYAPPAPFARPLDTPVEPADDPRPWLLDAVYERLRSGARVLRAELRPAAALMLAFGGLDYDDDPSTVARLETFVAWVQRTLARHGGSLIDVTAAQPEGYLYAAFGAPTATGDNAVRAVEAALELRAPPPELGLAPPAIGLAHGQVRAGVIGGGSRHTYAVLGDPANLAFRLMGHAAPGEIRCDAALYEQANSTWVFVSLPPIALKGKLGTLPIFSPTGSRAATPPPLTGRLIGRDQELARIISAGDTVAAGASRVVVLEGEAGTGKSRLLAEAVELLSARGFTLLSGEGRPNEQQAPYRAWRPIIAALLGSEIADLTTARPDLAERLPLLNAILDLGLAETPFTSTLEAGARARALSTLVAQLLRERAAEGALALCLEDAHWLDSGSWLLATRVAWEFVTEPASLLVLLALRPLEPNHPAAHPLGQLAALPEAARISLGPLTTQAAITLGETRLGLEPGEMEHTLAALLVERAEGNPLFVEELIIALDSAGLLGRSAGRCFLLGDPAMARALLPDTLQGLLLARLDRLPAEEQLTLKIASVVGTLFLLGPLQFVHTRMAHVQPEILRGRLRSLAARALTWLEQPDPVLAYRFRHVLIQEAAYETLLYAERRELHRAVAEWHEEAGTDFPLLAHHYRRAEDVERERHYARLAGIGAADRYANQEAVAYFTRALTLMPDGDAEGRFELLLARSKVYETQGEHELMRHDVEALEAIAETLADDTRRAQAAMRRAYYLSATGDFGTVKVSAERIARLGAGDPAFQIITAKLVATATVHRAEYAESRAAAMRGLELAHAHGNTQAEAQFQVLLGNIAWYTGELSAARAAYNAASELFQAAGDRVGESQALGNQGALVTLGDLLEGVRLLERSLALQRQIGDRRGVAINISNLGDIYRRLGQYSVARANLGRALALFIEQGDRFGEGVALGNLGDVLRATGALAAAAERYYEALAVKTAIGDRRGEALVSAHLAATLTAQNDYATAGAFAKQAVELAREVGAKPVEADALAAQAMLALAQGDYQAASVGYRAALELQQDLDKESAVLECLAGLVSVALAQEDIVEALALTETLLGILEQIAPEQLEAPGVVFLAPYRALSAAGDPRARGLLERGRRAILEHAARNEDEPSRRAFLEDVPVNRELLALALAP